MAFYFALLNVSAKKEEKTHKHRRRRHSIASVESPLLDYRLLPRPQVMGQDDDDPAISDLIDREKERSRSRQDHARALPNSESSNSAGRPTRNKRRNQPRDEVWEPREEHRSPNKRNSTPNQSDEIRNPEPQSSKNVHRIAKHTDNFHHPPQHPKPVVHSEHRVEEQSSSQSTHRKGKYQQHSNGRSRGRGRPVVVRRFVSPPESTTSGSRRSSRGSQNSLPRRQDTPSSSSCSRRESGEPQPSTSVKLVQASLKLSRIQISKSSEKLNEMVKSSQLKKVTFDNVNTPLIIGNNFLGCDISPGSDLTTFDPDIVDPSNFAVK